MHKVQEVDNIKPWLKIKVGNREEVDPSELIHGLTFLGDSTSPVLTNNYSDSSGSDGSIFNYATFDKSEVNANFILHFSDYYDFKLAQHDIYKLFMNKELIRIRTNAEPAIVKFVRAGNFEIKPWRDGAKDAMFTIPFENPSGYKYSYLTSDNPYLYSTEGWQIGMNLPNGDDLHYQFTTPQMRVYNASDIAIEPYFQHHQIKITMKYQGSSFELVNKTTQTSWKINKESNMNDTVVLDGINTFINGEPGSKYTDYNNISLNPGWNDIVAKGASQSNVTFSFPFIYLG